MAASPLSSESIVESPRVAADAASGAELSGSTVASSAVAPASGASGSMPAEGPRPGMPRLLMILLGLAAAWIALSGMRQLAALIVPVFLALNLMMAMHPLGRALVRMGVPRLLGSLATMLAVLVALFAFVATIGWAIAQLITELPRYADQLSGLVDQVLALAEQAGVDSDQVSGWASAVNVSSLVGPLQEALNSVGAISGLLTATLATIVFFGLDAAGLPSRLAVMRLHHPSSFGALRDFTASVRTYWVVTTVFGAIVAAIDGLALWALGVPLPGVWAVLLFLCNYIPNIGFVFAMIPPTLMALLDEGPWTALLVVVLCTTVAMVLQGLVQPRVTGRAVGVSPSVSFLSVLFWSWVLGAAGALLSVPMTLLVKAMLVDADPRSRWVNAFLADDPRDATLEPGDRSA